MMKIIFITRSWHGTGGMQRLSRDLWEQINLLFGPDAKLCHPKHPGLCSLIGFAVRALLLGVREGRRAHIHLGDASLLPLGALPAVLCGARVTATANGLDVVYPAVWYQWLLRRSFPSIRCICANSKATAEELRKRGVKDSQIVVIPCGMSTQILQCRTPAHATRPLRLLSICRFVPRKGIAWFLESVFPLLLKRFPDIQYRVVGDGRDRLLLENIIRDTQLSASVELLGIRDMREHPEEILTSDLLIVPNIPLPGTMEGFGIVCLEASAHGLPVVAARLEGLQDAVLEGETGFFFRPQDAGDAACVIERALSVPLNPASVADATRRHYDWSVLMPAYADLFSR